MYKSPTEKIKSIPIVNPKSIMQFEKTAQFYQPPINNGTVKSRYNDRGNDIKLGVQGHKIGLSNPSTSDTQNHRGTTPQSPLQTSEQSTPPQCKQEITKSMSNNLHVTSSEAKFGAFSQRYAYAPRIKSGMEIGNPFHEAKEVSFGEQDAALFSDQTSLRRSGRRFFVRQQSQPVAIQEVAIENMNENINENKKQIKYSQEFEVILATLQKTTEPQPNIFKVKNNTVPSSEFRILSPKVLSPPILHHVNKGSPLPDIFMTPSEKRKSGSQSTGFKIQTHQKCQSQQLNKRAFQDFMQTSQQLNPLLVRHQTYNNTDVKVFSKMGSMNTELLDFQPEIKLPRLESAKSMKSRPFLQRKAQIKIINRIFSGKSQQ